MTEQDNRIDRRTCFRVRKQGAGKRLIYCYARNDRLSAAIIERVYAAEVEAGRLTERPNNVTLGVLDGATWRPSPTPYAVALSGLPKIRARIDALVKGVSPPVRVTGGSGRDKPPGRRRPS